MDTDVATALDRLAIQDRSKDLAFNDILDHGRPLKRQRRTAEINAHLQTDFLTPAADFSTEWLNRLQQRWAPSIDPASLCSLAATQSRTVTRFVRKGLQGRVTDYHETTVPATMTATAKNSTSLLRKPGDKVNALRGTSGSLPFMDAIEATAAIEDQILSAQQPNGSEHQGLQKIINFAAQDGLLTTPPGFTRGLVPKQASESAAAVEDIINEEPHSQETTAVPADPNDSRSTPDTAGGDEEDPESVELDALLPDEFPALAPRSKLVDRVKKNAGRRWAQMVDVKNHIKNFDEVIPAPAMSFPFTLDPFQQQAIYHVENGESIFVAAHTSAGKTVIAEYAIALANKHMCKAIYTSPIKALSNQKFRDFSNQFPSVGLVTGDVQINAEEAQTLVMTMEVLRSMLLKGSDVLRDLEWVIIDEVHWVNDSERGTNYEEALMLLPSHANIIMLSATVPNAEELADWVGRLKQRDIYVITTNKRPVPLEHYLWADKKMHKIIDENNNFIEKGWKSAHDALTGRDKIVAAEQKAKENEAKATADRGGRGGQSRGGQQRGGANQRGAAQRGRGQPAPRGRGNIARTGRGNHRTTAAQDRNIYINLIQHLRKVELLPACIFIFSKRRIEENADSLSNQDFLDASQKSLSHRMWERSIARLRAEDRLLPQIRRMREMTSRGVGVHHSGLLPIVKEVVELLFIQGLISVVLCSESLAVGLNMPARTAVFSSLRKFDNNGFRDLDPSEYRQISGRAGRRGLDKTGTVIIMPMTMTDEAPSAQRLRQICLGEPKRLRSQFRLSYNLILQLLRLEQFTVEAMIRRSFSEHARASLIPSQELEIQSSEADLAKIKRDQCDICDIEIDKCHNASVDYQRLTQELHLAMLQSTGRKLWQAKRLVVFKGRNDARTAGILLWDGASSKSEAPSVQILEILYANKRKRQDADILPYLPRFREMFIPLPQTEGELQLRTQMTPVSHIEALTDNVFKDIDIAAIMRKDKDELAKFGAQILQTFTDWSSPVWNEIDYHQHIKEMDIRTKLDARTAAAEVAQSCQCIMCPNFIRHYAQTNDQWLIREKIAEIRALTSDQNLRLLPDYHQRIDVLKELSFIDKTSRLELKGKVACEINSADELVLTELILENALADYEPEEIVALLSCFIFEERTDSKPTLTPALQTGIDLITSIAEKVNDLQIRYQIILSSDESNDFVSKPRFGLVEVVYEWARGMPFHNITNLTDVLEGTIVRSISRLDGVCREVANAARIIGDSTLYTKMQAGQESIKRDICATASLYM